MARKKKDTAEKVKRYQVKSHDVDLFKLSKPYSDGIEFIAVTSVVIGGAKFTSVWHADKKGTFLSLTTLVPTCQTTTKALLKNLGYKLI